MLGRQGPGQGSPARVHGTATLQLGKFATEYTLTALAAELAPLISSVVSEEVRKLLQPIRDEIKLEVRSEIRAEIRTELREALASGRLAHREGATPGRVLTSLLADASTTPRQPPPRAGASLVADARAPPQQPQPPALPSFSHLGAFAQAMGAPPSSSAAPVELNEEEALLRPQARALALARVGLFDESPQGAAAGDEAEAGAPDAARPSSAAQRDSARAPVAGASARRAGDSARSAAHASHAHVTGASPHAQPPPKASPRAQPLAEQPPPSAAAPSARGFERALPPPRDSYDFETDAAAGGGAPLPSTRIVHASERAQRPSGAEAAAAAPMATAACAKCARPFSLDRLARHEATCKLAPKRPPKAAAEDQQTAATPAAPAPGASARAPQTPPPPKPTAAAHAAPRGPPADARVPCPICARKFDPLALDRHQPICERAHERAAANGPPSTKGSEAAARVRGDNRPGTASGPRTAGEGSGLRAGGPRAQSAGRARG
jgi:hypothetical protein